MLIKRPSHFIAALLLGFMLEPAVARGQALDLSGLNIEDLMKVKVTSASKKEQQLFRTAAAAFVLTNEAIRRSGATTIPDVGTNPWLKFYNNRRGYVRTAISPTQLRADFRAVAKVSEHGAAASTVKSFVVQEGQPGLQAV